MLATRWLLLLFSSVFAAVVPTGELKIDSEFIKSLQDKKYSRTGSAPHCVAHHPVLQRKFFVKTHRKGEQDALELELKALRTLHDTNYVPNVYGAVKHNYLLHLVMEHVNSFNLGKIEKHAFRQKIYPYAIFYISQILQALEIVNSAGLLYVDMKAENVLIDRNGLVVLSDFGACGTPEEVARHEYSKFCSPLFAAPEILLEGNTKSLRSCASEWWSFGVVCYLFFKGQYPFMADHLYDLMDLLTDSVHSKQGLTPDETTLVNSLLEKDVSKRLGYHSGIDLLKALPYFAGVDWTKVLSRDLVSPLQFEESEYTH